MLIATATNREHLQRSATGDQPTSHLQDVLAALRFALEYAALVVTVRSERRALGRLSPERLADIGRSQQEVEAEAKRPLFDLPESRLHAIRSRMRRG